MSSAFVESFQLTSSLFLIFTTLTYSLEYPNPMAYDVSCSDCSSCTDTSCSNCNSYQPIDHKLDSCSTFSCSGCSLCSSSSCSGCKSYACALKQENESTSPLSIGLTLALSTLAIIVLYLVMWWMVTRRESVYKGGGYRPVAVELRPGAGGVTETIPLSSESSEPVGSPSYLDFLRSTNRV
ncbi:hypothetical protein CEUSTIGMA_g1815.t1 [Chlamydomonas eustigma]|uniref:TNFR-Cys domain-containing protein n=1 Tax=Chlamydomonas eustigma TaxID=1157962 RepID=A0A250WUC2_9CHLO|nr:hypothetical protein CEUSTIGMA_g1815.t1 [Chlamydomonas eustigma]|eukprot:GAX74366.1 hypothetical protein CEUSTIGMA_g1815.t1 [Chlamydomonas eustigma]